MVTRVIKEIKRNKMSCITRSKCLKSYFRKVNVREVNVRIPILEKPLLWSPIITIFSA